MIHNALLPGQARLYAEAVPVEMPVGLKHLDSPFCWCDPLNERDDNGNRSVLHRHVTWN
jgi:hypothetical protein